MTASKPRVGISECLLGRAVRWDGGDRREDALLEALGPHVEWVPICPEAELGLGVPREPIRLAGAPARPRLLGEQSGADHTDAMTRFAEARVAALARAGLDGCVLKADSPSCGPAGVRVWDDAGVARREGAGVFARVLQERLQDLPVADEVGLRDPALRARYLERVLARARGYGDAMATMTSVNPATGEVLERFEEHTDAEVEARLARAAETFRRWRRTAFAERAALLQRAAEVLEGGKERFGRTITEEMGKTLRAAIAEVEKCAWVCRYYAEHGARFLADEPAETGAAKAYVRYLPIGAVLAVMPWNFPFWQVFRFAAPTLMAGNVGLLKHASNVPRSALAIEAVLRDAGFPEGCFQTLLVGSSRVGRLVADDRIAAATLTGSEAAGAAVAAAAGKAIKKTVLELGGSDAFVVMPSANLEAAVKAAVAARTVNNGQSCIAAKRFVVHEAVYEPFVRAFARAMGELVVGDPMDPLTDVGPLSSSPERDKLVAQVRAIRESGGRVVVGGAPKAGKGFYYSPTVIVDVPLGSAAARDEVFGPVAMVFRVADADGALEVANGVPFGLGSSVWTNDPAERERFVDELEAGATFVNAMVASDPRLPFGGVKRSGYGRELASHGIREFVNAKAVSIADVPAARPPATE